LTSKKKSKDQEQNKPAGTSSEDLASGVQMGSRADFTELVNRFGPRLFAYFFQKVANREDCEDLVQDTFIKVYLNIQKYNQDWAFSTWIFTIGTRCMADYFRKQKKRRSVPIPSDLHDPRDPFRSIRQRDEKNNLWALARDLPEKQFTALWLRYAEDLPVLQIARVMGITRVHVKVLLYRARVNLAKKKGSRRTGRNTSEDSKIMHKAVLY